MQIAASQTTHHTTPRIDASLSSSRESTNSVGNTIGGSCPSTFLASVVTRHGVSWCLQSQGVQDEVPPFETTGLQKRPMDAAEFRFPSCASSCLFVGRA